MINDLDIVQWDYLLSPEFELINSAGKPLTGGYIEVYIHGTRNKYYCASDFDGTLHPFQIPLDALGANIVLADPSGAYDVYVYNKYGSLIMSRYNVHCQGYGGTALLPGDKLYYGQFYATNVATNARLTKMKGNIDITQDGKLELKEGMSYHITVRGQFKVNDTSNVDTALSYVEYTSFRPINVNVDYTKEGEQYFELSYDVYRLSADMEYPVAFLENDGLIDNLYVEVHSLSNLATSSAGGDTDYTAGWGIVIDSSEISVDPTVIQAKLTAGSGIYIDPVTNVVSATNEIEIITTQTTYQELCDIVDSGKIPILKIDENAVGQTGTFAYEQLTADFRDSNRFLFGRIENQSWEGGVIYFNGHICYGDRPYYWSSYGRFIATTDMVHDYTAGSYVSIDNDVISVTGIDPGSYATHYEVDYKVASAVNVVTGMIPEAQVQSDWDETDTADPSYIQNKPDLGVYVTHDELATSVSGFATHVEVYDSMVSAINVATGLIPTDGDTFYAEVHVTPYSEIKAAYDAGYTIYAVYHAIGTSDQIYSLEYHVDEIGGGGAEFKFTNIDEGRLITAHCYEQPAGHSSTGWNVDSAITIPAAQVQTDWNATYGMASILNKPDLSIYATDSEVQESIASAINYVTGIIPSAQVQSDWTEDNPASASYIQNKPDEYGLVAGEHITLAVSGDNVIINSDDQTEIFNYGTSTLSEIGAAVNEGKTVMVGRSAYGVDYYGKLDKYQSGAYSFTYLDGNSLVTMKIEPDGGDGTWSMTSTSIPSGYTAGRGININNNVISADPDNTTIGWDTNDKLSVMRPVPAPRMPLDVGKVLTVDANGDAQWASASGTEYTAGDNIDISNKVISLSDVVVIDARSETASGSLRLGNVTHWGNQDYGPGWIISSHTDNNKDYLSYNTSDQGRQDFYWGEYANDRTTNGVSGESFLAIEEGDIVYRQGQFQDVDTLPVVWSCSQMATAIDNLNNVVTGIPEIELNSQNQVTAIDGHVIAGTGGDGPWYDMADMTAANTELWDTLYAHLQSGKSDNVVYTYSGQQYIGYTALPEQYVETIIIYTRNMATAYTITYLQWRWIRGLPLEQFFPNNTYYNKQLAGNGLQTTDVNNGTMSVKLGNGLYFDANNAIAATAAGTETIVIDYSQMTAANTSLFDTVFDALDDGKRVLFTQWNNTSNRDTSVGVATDWTDTDPYSITFKMQYYSGTYLNTDTIVWTKGSAATRSSSSARFNFQNAGDGLQTTSASNGTMSVKLGDGLYFDADNAVAVSGIGSEVQITPVLSSGVKIAEYAVDGVSGELFAPQGGGSTYTAGDNIDISNNVISVSGTGELIAGENITIAASGNDYVISSAGGGSGNIFEVIHGTTTFSDINTAFNDGKTLLFVHYPSSYDSYGTFTGTLVAKDTYTYVFGGFTDGYSTSDTTTYVEYTISQWTGWSNTPRSQRSFNMQADWNQTNSNSGDYIKNKPTIHTYTGANGINISNDVVSLNNPISLVPGNNIEISVSGVSAIISSTGGGGGGSATLPISGVNGNYTAQYGIDSAVLDYNLPSVGGGEPEHSTNTIQPGFISISTSYDGDTTDESVFVGPEYIEFKANDGTYTTLDPSSIANWNDAIVASQIASAAVVASLPANPLSNVLYLIPES